MRAVSTAKSAILDNASCAFLQDEIHYSHIHILTPIPEATWSNVDDPILFFHCQEPGEDPVWDPGQARFWSSWTCKGSSQTPPWAHGSRTMFPISSKQTTLALTQSKSNYVKVKNMRHTRHSHLSQGPKALTHCGRPFSALLAVSTSTFRRFYSDIHTPSTAVRGHHALHS